MRSDDATDTGEILEFPRQHQFRHSTLIERHFGILATMHQMPIYLLCVEPLTRLREPGDYLCDQNGMAGRYVMERNGSHGIPFSIENPHRGETYGIPHFKNEASFDAMAADWDRITRLTVMNSGLKHENDGSTILDPLRSFDIKIP